MNGASADEDDVSVDRRSVADADLIIIICVFILISFSMAH